MKHTIQVEVGGRSLSFETGEVARQAGGSVLMRYGDTVVIVTATKEDRVREGIDFRTALGGLPGDELCGGSHSGGVFPAGNRPPE